MFTAHMVVAGVWLQESDALSATNTKWLMIFIGIVAFSAAVQAGVVVAMAVGTAKTHKKLLTIAEELHTKALPVMDSVQVLLRDTTPKVRVITDNLVETSHLVRSKAQEFDATLSDVNNRTRKQVQTVDGMITSTLTATAEIAGMVERGIKVPMREIAGLANGFRAGMDVLIGRVKSFGAGRQG
jgi:hypothetical protein